jgi:hypothetical protein
LRQNPNKAQAVPDFGAQGEYGMSKCPRIFRVPQFPAGYRKGKRSVSKIEKEKLKKLKHSKKKLMLDE